MSLRHTDRSEWVAQNAKPPVLYIEPEEDPTYLHSPGTHETDIDNLDTVYHGSQFQTVVVDRMLERVNNPVELLMKAHRVCKGNIYLIVLDNQRSSGGETKRTYTGKHVFDQCIKAGIDKDNIKLDHLNEYGDDTNKAYWLTTIDV